MSRKRSTPGQIIGKLREAEVALVQGQTTAQVGRTGGLAPGGHALQQIDNSTANG